MQRGQGPLPHHQGQTVLPVLLSPLFHRRVCKTHTITLRLLLQMHSRVGFVGLTDRQNPNSESGTYQSRASSLSNLDTKGTFASACFHGGTLLNEPADLPFWPSLAPDRFLARAPLGPLAAMSNTVPRRRCSITEDRCLSYKVPSANVSLTFTRPGEDRHERSRVHPEITLPTHLLSLPVPSMPAQAGWHHVLLGGRI